MVTLLEPARERALFRPGPSVAGPVDRSAGRQPIDPPWSRTEVLAVPAPAGVRPEFAPGPVLETPRRAVSPLVPGPFDAPLRLRDRILAGPGLLGLDPPLGPTRLSANRELTAHNERGLATSHAIKLASALLVTTSIGYGVGILVARFLGTERFGRLAGAEARATLVLAVLAFGLDTYTLLEVARRPGHAREFVPGVLAARAVLAASVTLAITALLLAVHEPREAVTLFLLYSVAQLILQMNAVLAACLQASGLVKGLPVSNLVAKAIWAAVIVGGIKFGLGSRSVPIGWIVGESLRFAYLSRRNGRDLGMRLTLRGQQVRRVLRASLPFGATGLVAIAAQLLDVNLLSFVTTDRAVGYYRNAQNLAAIAFFVGTVLPWVFTPLIARASMRSKEELQAVMRRGSELVMVLAIPGSVLLALNADVIISVSGRSYAPSAPSLRILSMVLAATYVIILAAMVLQAQGQSWFVVRVALVGVIIDAILLVAFVPMAERRFGDRGAGTAAAFAMLAAEIVVAGLLLRRTWDDLCDRRGLTTIGKTVLCGALVAIVDRFMAAQGFSWSRLFADVVLYGALLLVTKVLKVEDVRQLIRQGVGPEDAAGRSATS